MFNIGFGEVAALVVLGLLIFGPDRLPDAVQRASSLVRQLRSMAWQARQQVADAAGLDEQETARAVADLRELHPRRLAASVLHPAPDPGAGPSPTQPPAANGLDPDLT